MADRSKWTTLDYIKRILIFFNYLLTVCGLGMLLFGIWINATKSEYYIYNGNGGYISTSILLILGGMSVIVIGIYGIFAAYRGTHRLILFYFSILTVLFICEIIIGCIVYGQHDSIVLAVQTGLNSTLNVYYGVDQGITESIDRLQQQRKCCGTKSWTDWRNSAWHKNSSLSDRRWVPESCCITMSRDCSSLSTSPSNIYYIGCATALMEFVDENIYVIGGICFSLGVIQAVGIVLSFYYYLKSKEI